MDSDPNLTPGVERVNLLLTERDTQVANRIGDTIIKLLNGAMTQLTGPMGLDKDRARAIVLVVMENSTKACYASFGILKIVEERLDFNQGLDDMLKSIPPPFGDKT